MFTICAIGSTGIKIVIRLILIKRSTFFGRGRNSGYSFFGGLMYFMPFLSLILLPQPQNAILPELCLPGK